MIIARSEGASESKDGTVRVLYIGGPEAVNQAQAAQHYINSKSILPSGYHLQIIGGDSKVYATMLYYTCYYTCNMMPSHRNELAGIGYRVEGNVSCMLAQCIVPNAC